MFLKQLICLLVITSLVNGSTSNVLKAVARDASQSVANSLIGTAFDYDYFAPEARRAPSRHQKSNPTTTERPFIRYWNNFVRNIRVPVPSITWNMTNPLVNLFNAGATNVIDTPVGNYNRVSTKRKRSKSSKSKNTKKRKHTHTDYDEDEDETYQEVSYGGYGEPSYTVGYDPHRIMYFYDARTGQYYKMQTQYVNSYTLAEQQVTQQQQQQQQQSDEEGELQEADEIESTDAQVAMIDAQIEPPTAESVNERNENENETVQHEDEKEALSDAEEVNVSDEVEITPADVDISDDSMEEQTSHKQQLVEQIKSNKPKRIKIGEELRNSIGSYMRDDHFNRMRQQSKEKQMIQTQPSRLKTRPREKFTYYLLHLPV